MDVKAGVPNVDFGGSIPSLGLGAKIKAPKLDIGGDIGIPGVDVKKAVRKGDVELPSVEVKPEVPINKLGVANVVPRKGWVGKVKPSSVFDPANIRPQLYAGADRGFPCIDPSTVSQDLRLNREYFAEEPNLSNSQENCTDCANFSESVPGAKSEAVNTFIETDVATPNSSSQIESPFVVEPVNKSSRMFYVASSVPKHKNVNFSRLDAPIEQNKSIGHMAANDSLPFSASESTSPSKERSILPVHHVDTKSAAPTKNTYVDMPQYGMEERIPTLPKGPQYTRMVGTEAQSPALGGRIERHFLKKRNWELNRKYTIPNPEIPYI
jgi:hypothetical protein